VCVTCQKSWRFSFLKQNGGKIGVTFSYKKSRRMAVCLTIPVWPLVWPDRASGVFVLIRDPAERQGQLRSPCRKRWQSRAHIRRPDLLEGFEAKLGR
jgi:hypothetical protein